MVIGQAEPVVSDAIHLFRLVGVALEYTSEFGEALGGEFQKLKFCLYVQMTGKFKASEVRKECSIRRT